MSAAAVILFGVFKLNIFRHWGKIGVEGYGKIGEVEDFVVRAGLRYDYLSPEAPRLRDEDLPLGDDRTTLEEDEDLQAVKPSALGGWA